MEWLPIIICAMAHVGAAPNFRGLVGDNVFVVQEVAHLVGVSVFPRGTDC